MRYSDLDPDQRKTLRAIVREGRRAKANRVLLEAAVQTVLVEANARHLDHGDRDSVGAFQQRPSQGWGPAGETVSRDARQFFEAAKKAYRKGMSAGELAATVQRPAAQFRGRYAQRAEDAQGLLSSTPLAGLGEAMPATQTSGSRTTTRERQVTIPDRAGRYEAVKALFDGGSPLDFAMTIKGLDETQPVLERVPVEGGKEPAPTPRAKLKPGGGYMGTQGVAKSLAGIGMELGLQSTSEKRKNTNPYSGKGSDHDVGNEDAYAYDLSNGSAPTEEMDRAAYRIMRQLGDKKYKMGQAIDTQRGVFTINTDEGTFRVQVIYRGDGPRFGGNHRNHIHVGVKRIK